MNGSTLALADLGAIDTIMERAMSVSAQINENHAYVKAQLLHAHENVCRLDLQAMIEWKFNTDIIHDLVGIANALDRANKFEGHFWPRFAKDQ